MKEMNRREFIRKYAFGGAVLGLGGIVLHKPLEAMESGKYDIGQCKSVRKKSISELGWYDNEVLVETIKAGCGPEESQWVKPWDTKDTKNAAGSCTLIDMETLNGRHHKFLIDTGWNNNYMDGCFKREGIDTMLKNGEIEFLYISHEHLDHFWGLETTLKYNPEIKIIILSTFYPEGIITLKGLNFSRPVPEMEFPTEENWSSVSPVI